MAIDIVTKSLVKSSRTISSGVMTKVSVSITPTRQEDGDLQRLHDLVDRVGQHALIDAAADLHCRQRIHQARSGEHHAGGGARHVGRAGDGNADVGLLQRGRVVDAVAGHADDMACRLQESNKLDLVFGENARIDVVIERSARRRDGRAPRRLAARPPMPTRCAIAQAVATLSPVTITTRTPSSCRPLTSDPESARGGSSRATSPARRSVSRLAAGCDGEHAIASAASRSIAAARSGGIPNKRGDRARRTLDDAKASCPILITPERIAPRRIKRDELEPPRQIGKEAARFRRGEDGEIDGVLRRRIAGERRPSVAVRPPRRAARGSARGERRDGSR